MKTKRPGEDLVDLRYAEEGSEEYRRLLEWAEESGECLFCPKNLTKNNTVVCRAGKWVAIMNRWPYEHAADHFVLLSDEHKTGIEAVSGDDWNAIQLLIERLRQESPTLQIGGGLAVRFGTNSGVSIRHLHFHLIAPITNPDTGKVYPGNDVNFPIG